MDGAADAETASLIMTPDGGIGLRCPTCRTTAISSRSDGLQNVA